MAQKKPAQVAQEVQELTHDDYNNNAYGLSQADRLIYRAATQCNKPAEETTLQEAYKIIDENVKQNPDAQDDKYFIATKDATIKAAEKMTGKPAEEITGADIKKAIDSAPPVSLSDETLDLMSAAIEQTTDFQQFLETVSETITSIFQTPEFEALADAAKKTADFMAGFALAGSELAEITHKAAEFNKEILPFIVLEVADRTGERIINASTGKAEPFTLDEIKALLAADIKPEEEKTPFEKEIDRILDSFSFAGEPETDEARGLLEAANKRKADYTENIEVIEAITDIAESIEQAPDTEKAEIVKQELPRIANLPRIIAQQAETLDYPLDKPNSKIWDMLTTTDTNGQLTINFDTSKKGSGKEALIYYSIDFTELESLPELNITKQLTPFDKRVYIIAAALFNAGNEVITATQIYRADHNNQPNDKDLKKINDSLTKMGAAHIYIDNKQEVAVNKKYPKFKYDASLLPFERMSAYINGQLSEAAIHLLREPPLITFAKGRKQITPIDRQILLAPVNKTEANLRIEDYLIERILHMKNKKSKAPRKLLYSTIYENCGITGSKQKQRAPEKIRRFMDYYQECGLIKDYTETKEAITIVI